MDEIVNFGSVAYNGGPHGGAINGGMGSDFDVVPQNYPTHLGNFGINLGSIGGIAKSIRSDHGIGVEYATIANFAVIHEPYPGMKDAVPSNFDPGSHIGMGRDASPISDNRSRSHRRERTHSYAFAQDRFGVHPALGVETRAVKALLFKGLQDESKGSVGIRHPQDGGGDQRRELLV
jgi:hypothetical protein